MRRRTLKEQSSRADSRPEMPHRRWVYLTRVAAAAGLAAFAAYTLLAPADDRFFTLLQHLGLRRPDGARVRHRRIARLPGREGPSRVDRHHRRARCAGRSARSGTRSSSPRPTRRWPTRATSRSTRSSTSGIVLLLRSRARSIGGHALARRRDRRARRRSARRGGDLRDRRRRDRGFDLRRRHEPRVPARRRPPALRRLRRLLAHRAGGPGLRWLLLGLGVLSTAAADVIYLFQSAEGTYVEGTWIDILWPTALLLIASSAWVVDRTREGLDGRGSTAARRPGSLRARRHGHPRLRPLRSRQRARDRPCDGDARPRRRTPRSHVPREQPPLRADPRRRRRRTR